MHAKKSVENDIAKNYRKVPKRNAHIIKHLCIMTVLIMLLYGIIVSVIISPIIGAISSICLTPFIILFLFLSVKTLDHFSTTLYYNGDTFLVTKHRNKKLPAVFEFSAQDITLLKKVVLLNPPKMEIHFINGEKVIVQSDFFRKNISYGEDTKSFIKFLDAWLTNLL